VTDPFGGRPPTSHERMTGEPWDASYRGGPAPWDLGGPQPAVVRLVSAGAFRGSVLDVGCGAGDNACAVAASGLPVLGVDVAGTALEEARRKAADLGVAAQFRAADALRLEDLGERFDTVLDCGLFHTFDPEERLRYAAGLASVTAPGGTLHLLCFRDDGPAPGPHPVAEQELRSAFDDDRWRVVALQPERLLTRYHDENGAPAWLATIERR
jgi:SAM-dependent methyltransferase